MPTQPLAQRTENIKLSSIRQVTAKMEQAAKQGRKITNFAAGRPDFDSPELAKQRAAQAMAQGQVHYTKSPGLDGVREALARRLNQDFGLDLDRGDLIATMGGTEAMFVALQTILNPGDEVLVPSPMYVYYEGWTSLAGAKVVPVPLSARDGFQLTAGQLRPLLTPRTKALIINSPHNPTGLVFPEAELRRIADLAREADFYVVCDEVYHYLVYDGARHFPLAAIPEARSRVLTAGSLSKTYAMDGWRLGYLSGPRKVMERALKVHQYAVACVNTFVQLGAQAVLEADQDWREQMLARLARRRTLMLSALDDMGLTYVRPDGAFYAFPDISRFGLSCQEFSDYLFDQAQVAVVPGDAFGPEGRGHVRMAYCLPYAELEQALERMRKALQKL